MWHVSFDHLHQSNDPLGLSAGIVSRPNVDDRTPANVNQLLMMDFELIYEDHSPENDADPFADGEVVLGEVTPNQELLLANGSLGDPFHWVTPTGEVLTNEVVWLDDEGLLEYALSSNDDGIFDEIIVHDRSDNSGAGTASLLGVLVLTSEEGGNRAPADINQLLMRDYNLIYNDHSPDLDSDPFFDGETVVGSVSASGELFLADGSLTDPFHWVFGEEVHTNEVVWEDETGDLEFALSSNDEGVFNEINVFDLASVGPTGGPAFLGSLTLETDGGGGDGAPCGSNEGGTVTGAALIGNCAGAIPTITSRSSLRCLNEMAENTPAASKNNWITGPSSSAP